jgi:hypothetical protein
MKPHGLARRIIAAQLTKGLSVKEAAEITGLTIDQIKKARLISKEFDLSLLKMEVSNEILFFDEKRRRTTEAGLVFHMGPPSEIRVPFYSPFL